MSGRTTIWAITSGEYSDYRVDAIFDTEAGARKALDSGMGDDITELDYYDAETQPERRAWTLMGVHLKPETGDIQNWFSGSDPDREEKPYANRVFHHPSRPKIQTEIEKVIAPAYPKPGIWRITVEGVDSKRLRKVFYDLVAKTRAEIIEGLR